MANVTATGSISNVNVSSTISNITVSDTLSNIAVSNISSQTVNVAVTSTNTTVNVAALATVANSSIRNALSATTTAGSLGTLSYASGTGVFNLNGPSVATIRSQISNTSPITYNSTSGVIGLEQTLDDLTLKKYQETVVANGNVSGAVSFEINSGTIHTATLTGNVTNLTLSNISTGGSAFIILTQNAIGGHSLDTSSGFTNFRFVGNVSTINQSPNQSSILTVVYDGSKFNTSINRFDGTTLAGFTTDDLAEGSTNKYFTDARARLAISATSPLSYNNSTGVMSITEVGDISEVIAGTGLTGGGSTGAVTLNVAAGLGITANPDNVAVNMGAFSTTNLAEGTNLYYTTARANTAITDYIGSIENAPFAFAGNLNVTGNITASGNVNYENVVDLNVQDQEITLNSNAASDATVSIIANRPSGNNAVLRWNETSDIWQFNNTGSYFPLATSTTDLAEGTNLYYTTARSNTDFDARFTSKSTSDLAEGTNLYYTNARADARVDAKLIGNNSGQFNQIIAYDLRIKDGPVGNVVYRFGANSASSNQFLVYDGTQFKPTTPSTSIVNEGTNQYFTTARANTAIGAYQGNISTAGTVTAALGSGKIYIGSSSNVSTTVTPSNNFDTSDSSSSSTTVAITLIQAKDNAGAGDPPADLVQLTGGQIISDGTLITISGVTTGNATGLNGNSYYAFYHDGQGSDDGYALYTNANQTGNVAVVTAYNTSGLGNATYTTTTTTEKFELANALANVNSITSESANDKFTFKALLGGAATVTDTGNITSDGYEIIIDSSHTYATAGNVAQTGSNNLNGFAVSGSFTSGSNAMTITGVTELKNVYNYSASIDGTNNNVSLTGDMVAGMIYDSSNGVDGDQFPLPQGTTLVSASASTLVFSENATATQSFSNAEPIAIVHGGKDATTGQLISFVSQDDAVADGTNTVNVAGASEFYGAWNSLSDYINFAGYTPQGNETVDTMIVFLSAGTTIPQSTAITPAGVTGPGNANINGQTFYIGNQIFDNQTYSLFTDSALNNQANVQTIGINVTFNPATGTENGNITYSTGAQSTSQINKARLYKQDTYGYPKAGPKAQDFTFTKGSASDYTVDYSAATTSVRGRTSLEAPKQVLKAPLGLTIGENTTMSNRGDHDTFTNFGLNFMWDGLTDYSTQFAGTTSNIVPQMLFKNHTDNTFGAGASGKGRGGPRLFFSAATGNINTADKDKYPRKSQEIGRMMFWGTTQSAGDIMSTVNPAGYISATASEDWTTNNTLEMSLAANGNGVNDADIFLNYRNGQVVLASGTNGSAHQPIHFAPALQGASGNAAQTYASVGHTWANVNYANVSATSGSKLTVTQGTTDANGTGDLIIALDREYIAGTARQALESTSNAGIGDLAGVTGESPTGNQTNDTMVITKSAGDPLGFSVGEQISFENVTGPGNANINGGTFYAGATFFGGAITTVWTSADGTTTPANVVALGVNRVTYSGPGGTQLNGTGSGNVTNTVTGTAAKDYSLALETGSDQLKIKSGSTAKITIDDNFTQFNDRIRLKNHTTSEINALASPAAGDVVFNTTLNLVCVYNGSGWRKLNDAAM